VPFDVYDYRVDVRNVVITPEIRARFLRLEPGEVASRHSHDLGQEVFLVLEGRCEFEIEGERAVLGPGQMCFARADQLHRVRTVGDEPMTMYLSVTPHVEPTHTWWDDQGAKLPPRYGVATERERATQPVRTAPIPELIARQVAAAEALAEAAAASARTQQTAAASLREAAAAGDAAAAKRAVDTMWGGIAETFLRARELADNWNALAPAATDSGSDPYTRGFRSSRCGPTNSAWKMPS